jgi:hypothetical protein
MKLARIATFGLACIWPFAAHGQPAQVLKDAMVELVVAGNYTWEQFHETDINGRRLAEKSWGKTVVDGYTVATIAGLPAIFSGNDSVVELKSGWRHLHDLNADEFLQVRRALGVDRLGTNFEAARKFEYAPIHDLLRAVAAAAFEVWQQDGVIKGEVPYEFDRHLSTGTLPSGTPLRSVLGLPRRAAGSGGAARGSTSQPNGALSVWIKDGNIAKVSVEFARTLTSQSGPRKGEHMAVTRTYVFEISKVGRTVLDVPPEAKALFVK